MKQQKLFKEEEKSYGGSLLKKRKGRRQGRPLDTRHSMHMVLRSSKATYEWSFRRAKNAEKIREIVGRFSKKYGIRILSLANVGNHLHFHMQLSTRHGYKPFIRAITAAIAMAVTGKNRWTKSGPREKFWDHRPFTRVIVGLRAWLDLKDYVKVNQLEGLGCSRVEAKFIMESRRLSSA